MQGCHAVDCRTERFTQLVDEFLDGAERVELFHAVGRVPRLARIAANDVDAFRAVIEDNLVTTYALLRTVAEAAVAHRVPGAMLVLGSVGGTRAHRYKAGYDAAKAVVHAVAVPATPVFDFANGATHLFDGGLAQQLRSQAIERPPEDWGVR
ncbi:SDR family oxidoreductase [Streptomyces sp. NPDC059037]|uniref:SDR family oxidoreductase n=1 Tax=Streptomyces sp. NPDC059037 TaxID=3346710 RepID=UPI0036B4ECA5